VANKKLSDRNNVNLIKGWLPRCRALTFIVVALLVGNLWGFTTDKDSTIDGDLTLNGVVKKTGCKSGYSLSGSLCIGSSQSSEAMYEAIDSCGDLHARVCTMQDMVYACQNGYADGELLESGMWLGNYIGDDAWATTNSGDCNVPGYNFDGPAGGHGDPKSYRCCY
jgi:hypothetical protein